MPRATAALPEPDRLMRETVRFVRNGRVVETAAPPDLTLLGWLRGSGSTGAKDGCSEGACGACTIAIGRASGDGVTYETVAACSVLLAQVDGVEIVAVEDIAAEDGTLHPVQRAMLAARAARCGFCAPGATMSLFALYQNTDGDLSADAAGAALQGHVCRCGSYRAMVAAAVTAGGNRSQTRHDRLGSTTAALLADLAADEELRSDATAFVAAPRTVDAAALLWAEHRDAVLVAGGSLAVPALARQARRPQKVILLGRAVELAEIEDTAETLSIGAAATLSAVRFHLAAIDPDLGVLVDRIGGPQLRSVATIGGNLAAGGRGADLAAALIALDAAIVLRQGLAERIVAADAFFQDDGKQDRGPTELVARIVVPKPRPGATFRAFKVAKRYDLAPATVTAAFHFVIDHGQIAMARIAYGGLGPAPRRAVAVEASLAGVQALDRSAWARAFAALRQDFAPLSDQRGSARYRMETGQALLGKALIEAGSNSDRRTRLAGFRDTADVFG
ncbi:MAG: FAD binding domain-containing protein [Bauldia sp.]|nr:FAD binding domain-containing protein [Bauldia sp.]